MIVNLTQPSPDVLRERLIAARAAQHIAEQEASGGTRVIVNAEASSIVARLIATDAVIAELAAQRVEMIARFRVLLAERPAGGPDIPTACASVAVLPFVRPTPAPGDDFVS